MALSSPLYLLKSPTLRRFLLGQAVSLIGTWMSLAATSWLVYRLTNSELWLGISAFASQFPTALLSPIAGVYIDRMDKRKAFILTQICSMLQSFGLFLMVALNAVSIGAVVALGLLQSIINAFDAPARQSFIAEIPADPQDIPAVVALHSSLFHGARLIGPTLAGILIATFGEGPCFLIDALSFGAVLIALATVRSVRESTPAVKQPLSAALKEGLRFIVNKPRIWTALVMVIVVALFGCFHITLIPVFARKILSGGPELYGYLMGASGFGAFCGAIVLAWRPKNFHLERVIVPLPFVLAATLLVLALSTQPILSGAALCAGGFALVILMIACNSIIQVSAKRSNRARVLSIYNAAFFAAVPLGGMLAGVLAERIGAPGTVLITALVDLMVGFWFIAHMKTRYQAAPLNVKNPIS